MPGPSRFYGRQLAQAVRDGEVDEGSLERRRPSPAHRVRSHRRARRRATPSQSPSTARSTDGSPMQARDGVDGAAQERQRAAARSGARSRTARGHRTERGAGTHHGWRLGRGRTALPHLAARRAAGPARRRRHDRARSRLRHRPHDPRSSRQLDAGTASRLRDRRVQGQRVAPATWLPPIVCRNGRVCVMPGQSRRQASRAARSRSARRAAHADAVGPAHRQPDRARRGTGARRRVAACSTASPTRRHAAKRSSVPPARS